MFYITIFIILFIFACLDLLLNRNIFIYAMGLVLIIIAGFRNYTVGKDTIIYYQQYMSNLSGITINNGFEIGYTFIQNIFTFFRIPWVGFALFICLFTLGIIISEFKMLSIVPAFSILYYYSRFYLYRDINQIRASLAAAIILLSFKYVYEKKPFRFLLILLIAETIHTGSIFAVIIYPLYFIWKKNNKHLSLSLFIVCCIVAVSLSFFVGNIVSILHISNNYLTNDYYVYGGRKGLLNPVIWYQFFLSCFALRLSNKHRGIKKNYFDVALISYFLSTIIIILFSQYYAFAGRLSTIFATTEPLVLMYTCQAYSSKIKLDIDNSNMNYLINRCIFLIPYIIITILIFYFIDYSSGQVSSTYTFI